MSVPRRSFNVTQQSLLMTRAHLFQQPILYRPMRRLLGRRRPLKTHLFLKVISRIFPGN